MPNSLRMGWPYPADGQNPWYEVFKSFVDAVDVSVFATREDRQLVISGGGTIAWSAPTLSWTDPIRISAALTGFQWQIPANAGAVLQDGQVLYVSLVRGPTRNITLDVAISNTVPSTDEALVLVVRHGSSVYLRSGVSILSGSSIEGFSPSSLSDTDAIHLSVTDEIAGLTEKATPIAADLIVIEDSAASNVKKKVQIGNLPGGSGTDPDAIHDNVAGEIAAITEKLSPTNSDLILIEDAADLNNKKRVQLGNLPVPLATDYAGMASGFVSTRGASPQEDKAGEVVFNGDDFTSIALRVLVTPEFATTGSVDVRLYDYGPAAGPPTTPRLVSTLTTVTDGGPQLISQVLTVVSAAPGTNEILDSARLYRLTVEVDGTAGDSVYVGGAWFYSQGGGTAPTVTDPAACHLGTAGEISILSEKAVPVAADVLLIEDSAGSYAKKKIQIGNLPGGSGTDPDAIHDNVAGEIAAVALKGTPTTSDLLLIEDAADSNNKKRITIGTLPGGAATAPRTAKIVVGNSPAGDTAADCTHLDTGNGQQLWAAISAATAGTDVYIRPGTYDFDLLPIYLPIVIPSGVRVWGAGRKHVQIRSEQTSSPTGLNVFELRTDSELHDVSIYVPIPADISYNSEVVYLSGAGSECHRVSVSFAGGYDATSIARLALTGVFYPQFANHKLVDCSATNIPSKRRFSAVPPSDYICGVRTPPIIGTSKVIAVERFLSTFGDVGIAIFSSSTVTDCSVERPWEHCLWSGVNSDGTSFSHNHCMMDRDGDSLIYLQSCAGVDVSGNYFTTTALGYTALVGIKLVSASQNTVRGNRSKASRVPISATLDASSNNNIVLGNNLPFTVSGITDLGAGNVVQHNL